MTVRALRPTQVRGRLAAPPSKSYTHRALVTAFLARRPTTVENPLDAEDTRATREGLRILGARVRGSHREWRVDATELVPRWKRVIRCGESGTTWRFLSAVASLQSEPVRFEGAARLAVRPMAEFNTALRSLGATVHTPSGRRGLPCTVHGPIHAGHVVVGGGVSSQFTSALLMVLPTLRGRSDLEIRGRPVSRPYVDATCAVLRDRGVAVSGTRRGFVIPGSQHYRGGRIKVPGDASSAAYLWAAAAVTEGSVEVDGVSTALPQADLAILPILARMGAKVRSTSEGVRVSGPISRPVSVDLTDSPDLFPLVAVLSAFVPGRKSRLRGAPHLEFKESNRREESIRLVRALGARVSSTPAGVHILGTGTPRSLNLPSLQDHRLVMSAAVAALAAKGVSHIGRAEAVSKSFPGFWDALGLLTRGGEQVV